MGARTGSGLFESNACAADVPPVDPADLLAALSRHKSVLRRAGDPPLFEAAWDSCFAYLSPRSRFALRLRLQALVFTLPPAQHGGRIVLRMSLVGAAAEANVWCVNETVLFDPAELEERATALEAQPAPAWAIVTQR